MSKLKTSKKPDILDEARTIGYMEGFTAPSSSTSSNNTNKDGSTTTSNTTNKDDTTTEPTLTDEQKQQLLLKLQEKSKDSSTTTTTSSSSVASEGFDIIGTENSIKRGKQSNSIPVNSYMKNFDDIQPFGGSFSDSYSAF